MSNAYKEVGTLKEIGAQPGDRVECVDTTGAGGSLGLGDEYEIAQSGLVIDAQGEEYDWIAPKFRIISRSQPGPVRTVTRRVIVPGVYGDVEVSSYGEVRMIWVDGLEQLDSAIATLTVIRDAMQANATA